MTDSRSLPLSPKPATNSWLQRSAPYWGLGLVLLIFAVFLVWPIVHVVRVGFYGVPVDGQRGHFTWAYILEVFRNHSLRMGLINSAAIAVCVTIICTIISVPLALLSRRYEFRGKGILNGLLLVPLILPPFVGAIGMRQILGRFGVLTSLAHDLGFIPANTPIDWVGATRLFGIVFIEALSLYPILD
jgi:iron(III) transport system permease protein